MSLPAMSLGLTLCSAWAERAGQGEVGGYTCRVHTAWPHLGSSKRLGWDLGGPFQSFLAKMELETSNLTLFCSYNRLAFLKRLS